MPKNNKIENCIISLHELERASKVLKSIRYNMTQGKLKFYKDDSAELSFHELCTNIKKLFLFEIITILSNEIYIL